MDRMYLPNIPGIENRYLRPTPQQPVAARLPQGRFELKRGNQDMFETRTAGARPSLEKEMTALPHIPVKGTENRRLGRNIRRPTSSRASSFESDLEKAKKEVNSPYSFLERQWRRLKSIDLPQISAYQRLFSFIFLGNMIGCVLATIKHWQNDFSVHTAATVIGVNLFLSVAFRLPPMVNMLFLAANKIANWSHTSCLVRRKILAQIHHYGGVHSGCASAVTLLWYPLYVAMWFESCRWDQTEDIISAVLTAAVCSILALMLAFSLPPVRREFHDYFEIIHRFCGWGAIGLIWAHTVLGTIIFCAQEGTPLESAFAVQPAFWFGIGTTVMIIYPWVFTRRADVHAEHLSTHALRMHFNLKGAKSCMAIKLATNPLREWHPFAVIPEQRSEGKFSVIISKAGDWTKRLTETPPNKIWVRAVPTRGVLWNATMFRSIVVVATGSGIGPCLGLFNGYPELCVRVLWTASNVEVVFGREIIDAVRRADPRAKIIDTKKEGRPGRDGRPELWQLALELYREEDAEACFVICNESTTRKTVCCLRSQKVSAYGPIWDS